MLVSYYNFISITNWPRCLFKKGNGNI